MWNVVIVNGLLKRDRVADGTQAGTENDAHSRRVLPTAADVASRFVDLRSQVLQNASPKMQNAKCSMQNAECSMQNERC
jgi:hypothetical protein